MNSKYLYLTFVFILFLSTSFVNDRSDHFYIEINQTWSRDDWNYSRKWIVRYDNIIYSRGCKTDTFKVKNLHNSKELYRLLDSLHYIENYACKGQSSLHSESRYKLFSTWVRNDKEGYFSFSIINCQLNKNLDTLVNLLNTYIPVGHDAVIPKIQEGFGDCKCKAYKEVKVFEE